MLFFFFLLVVLISCISVITVYVLFKILCVYIYNYYFQYRSLLIFLMPTPVLSWGPVSPAEIVKFISGFRKSTLVDIYGMLIGQGDCLPLASVIGSCLAGEVFSESMKISKTVPVYKKDDLGDHPMLKLPCDFSYPGFGYGVGENHVKTAL